jgi:hypothetical protein
MRLRKCWLGGLARLGTERDGRRWVVPPAGVKSRRFRRDVVSHWSAHRLSNNGARPVNPLALQPAPKRAKEYGTLLAHGRAKPGFRSGSRPPCLRCRWEPLRSGCPTMLSGTDLAGRSLRAIIPEERAAAELRLNYRRWSRPASWVNCVWSFRSIRGLRIRKQIIGSPQKLVSSGRARFQAHTFTEATLMKTKSQAAILGTTFGLDPFL